MVKSTEVWIKVHSIKFTTQFKPAKFRIFFISFESRRGDGGVFSRLESEVSHRPMATTETGRSTTSQYCFFLFQTKFLKLHHQSVIKLDSKFYDSYLNAILHVSEYGLKLSKLNPWGQLRARKNPRRRRLLHESQGLPPQLTLALLQIKKCSRFASSDFQLYNAYLQQAFLSDLAGRENQRFNAIKAAAELHPSPRLYLELAAIYKSRKDYSKMHTYNQKAIRLDPNAIEISGPQPSVELKQQKISKDDSFSKTIASLSKRIESSQIIDKKFKIS